MILAIDFGTTNLKAALVDKNGNFYNFKSERVPTQVNDISYEVDSNVYLSFIKEYLLSADTKKIDAIITSSNGPSILSLYEDIKFENNTFKFSGSNTRLWMDKRGEKYSKVVSQYYNTYIAGSFFLPTILNIKENETALYNKTKYFFTIDGFINYALTKQPYTVNNADMLLKYYWNEESLEYFKLDKTKFPKFINSGNTISTIDKEVAKAFNLNENVKVIAGGSDFYFSIIGSKINQKNTIADIIGTSEGVNLCIENPIKDDRFLCYEHPLKDHYNISGVISNSGIALNWIRQLFKISNENFNQLYEMAEKSKKSNLIFLPYLTGERAPIWNPNATGQFFNLTLDTNQEEIVNAVLEGTIFAFKSVIKNFEELGEEINEIHITTSKYELDYYYQLKSNITNKKIVVYQVKSAELLGLSMLGYTTINEFKSLYDAINKMSLNSKEYYPQKESLSYYEQKFSLFNELYVKTKSLMSK